MQVTRFPARAEGLADRMTGFVAHLRDNGARLGPREAGDALAALAAVEAWHVAQAREALRALLCGNAEDWRRFDDLFDSYWFNAGKTRPGAVPRDETRVQASRPKLWQPHFDGPEAKGAGGDVDAPDDGDGGDGASEGTEGRLIATRTAALTRRDLREVMDEHTLRQAERIARDLARALRDRRSRRRRAASKGREPDLRRTLRKSLSRGGEPFELCRKRRPDRPVRIVVLCDVSGSMTVYARVFLAFLKGLVGSGLRTDAYLFHTRLMRVTDALTDHDSLRAAARLSLMAEGFGGGTDISGALTRFAEAHGARALDSRTVLMILSDGYCTRDAAALPPALARLRRKAGRVIWLNPLAGWRDHATTAAAMQAALPYLDALYPANTLQALAALEPEFTRL
jgi:uncharacterized protein with von Willebrand factor type A (vWA) domain